jgi:hypothetical protein
VLNVSQCYHSYKDNQNQADLGKEKFMIFLHTTLSVLPVSYFSKIKIALILRFTHISQIKFWAGVMAEYGCYKGEFLRSGREWTTVKRDNMDSKVLNILHWRTDPSENTGDLWGINWSAYPVWNQRREFIVWNLPKPVR